MIEYENGVIVMDLVDLEHCGFEWDTFNWELRASFVDPATSWPVALLVNFAGGAVVTAGTSAETLARMKEANERFQALRKRACPPLAGTTMSTCPHCGETTEHVWHWQENR